MSIYITGDVHGDFSELQQWCCAMEPKKNDSNVVFNACEVDQQLPKQRKKLRLLPQIGIRQMKHWHIKG